MTIQAIVNQQSLFAYRSLNTMVPRQKPKGVYVPLDFTNATGASNGADILVDLELLHEMDRLAFVQTVFIDNTLSGQNFSLTASNTRHVISLTPGKQGFLPMIAIAGDKFIASTGAIVAAGLIKVQFLNFEVQPFVW